MINRILMELYDDYIETKKADKLLEFTRKTFPKDGTDILFVSCVLIMFSIADGYKPRYFCTRENLLSIVLLAKEKLYNSNLLEFYAKRVNKSKSVGKYLSQAIKSPILDKNADLIIDYLNQFKFDFVSRLKEYKSLGKYIKSISGTDN